MRLGSRRHRRRRREDLRRRTKDGVGSDR